MTDATNMKHQIVISNAAAMAAAYAEDRQPRTDEAERVIVIDAPAGISHLNGAVQQVMMAQGYNRNDWKIVSHRPFVHCVT